MTPDVCALCGFAEGPCAKMHAPSCLVVADPTVREARGVAALERIALELAEVAYNLKRIREQGDR